MNDASTTVDVELNDNPLQLFKKGKSLIENSEKGINYLKESIENGCTEAAIYYSQLLIQGEIIPKNYKRAKKYLETKLNENNSTVYFLYGKILNKERKYKEAKKYLLLSIKGGNGNAMYEYGKMLYKGKGSIRNKKEANFFFEMSKKNGCHKSDEFLKKEEERREIRKKILYKTILFTFLIGILAFFAFYIIFYFDAKEFFDVENTSIQFLKRAAKNGDVDSMFEYGILLLKGKGIQHNKKEALHFLKKAADNGHIKSMKIYSDMIRSNKENPDQIKEASKYMKKAADLGDIEAMYRYGIFLNNGDGVQKNSEEATKYMKNAADKGHTKAMIFYSKLIKKTVNDDDSLKYLKMAADKNDINGMYLMALELLDGDDINKLNKEKGIDYLKKSADGGQRDALYKLAIMTLNGDGVEKNLEYAKYLLKSAANKGQINAIHDYRVLFSNSDKNDDL